MKLRTAVASLWLLLTLSLPTLAVQPDEMLKDPQLEARARTLSEGFRCLVCQNQSIDESDAGLARDLRLLIRERLTKGDSDQQVKAFVVDRYGDYVLLKPRFGANTLLLWILPFALVLAGLVYVFAFRGRGQLADGEGQLSAEELKRLSDLN